MKIICLMENTGRPGLLTEHGLSLYIEAGGRKILFDAGQSGAFADNASALGVNLADVDFAVLSHGHYDHGGGLTRFMEINRHAPVYVSRHAFGRFYSGPEKYIGLDPALKDHPRIVTTGDDLDLGGDMTLCAMSGARADFPAFGQGLTMETGGARVPDDFRHEQYFTIIENGRRILFSGCSHRGVMNIARWLKPDVLIGGFHFMKLDPDSENRAVLLDAAECLSAFPTRYYTCHCTGEAPYAFLKERMGDRLEYLSCGQTLVL